MALKFDLIDGPFGDCTSRYDVVPDRKLTLNELIDEILERTKEWGYIGIKNNYSLSPFGHPKCEYRYGVLKTVREEVFTQEQLNSVVYDIDGHGGWTNMNYLIVLE